MIMTCLWQEMSDIFFVDSCDVIRSEATYIKKTKLKTPT